MNKSHRNSFLNSSISPPVRERPTKRVRAMSSGVIEDCPVRALTDVGISCYKGGDYKKAEKTFKAALCRFDAGFLVKSISPPLDQCTPSSCSSSSSSSSEKQQSSSQSSRHEYDEGMNVYTEALPINCPSQSHSFTDITPILLYNIAQTYLGRGEFTEAAYWLDRAAASVLPMDAQSAMLVIKILHNLGRCAYRNGQNTKALLYYEKALALVTEVRISELDVASTLNCVGVIRFHLQGQDMAQVGLLFSQSLELIQLSKKVMKRKDQIVATVLNNLGRCLYLQSKFEAALEAYGQSRLLREAILGNASLDLAATVYNIGQTQHQLKMLPQALENYSKFLEIAKRAMPDEKRDIALVMKGIAEIHQQSGDLKQALNFYKKALELQQQAASGTASPECAATLNKLGNLCYEMEDHSSAMKFYKQGLAIESEMLPENHPHIIISKTNIAHIYKHQGNYKQALLAYESVRDMQVAAHGAESIQVAEVLSSMGLMQYHIQDYEAAFDSYQEALRIRRDQYKSDDHPDIASTLNSVGLVLFKQSMFELARTCFMEGLRIRRKLLGDDHRDCAILWYNIATIYFELGEEDSAIRYFKETLRVERAALGHDHVDVVLTLQHLGQVFQQLGKLDEALHYFTDALETNRRILAAGGNAAADGKDHISSAKILNLIGNCHLQQGSTQKMMECYVSASRCYQSSGEELIIAGYNFYGLSKINPPAAPVA